jgi:hypothetical protein
MSRRTCLCCFPVNSAIAVEGHASVIKLVRTYLADLERFGQCRFEIAVTSSTGADLEDFGLVRFQIQPRSEGQHGGGSL